MAFIDNSIYIVPNKIKIKLLKELSNEDKLYNIKFLSLEEFISHLIPKYNEKAIPFLMKKYKYNNANIIIDNIKYVHDEDYGNKKIKELINLKNELNEFEEIDLYFKDYINNKNIIVYGYDYIDRFSKRILDSFSVQYIKNDSNNYVHDVYKFNTIFDEVIFVSNKIKELIEKGISLNKIKIVNMSLEYSFILPLIFNIQGLKINTNKENIYSSNICQKYLELYDNDIDVNELSNYFSLKNEENLYVYNKIIDVLNKYSFDIEKDIKKEIIINEFKKIKTYSKEYDQVIEVVNLNEINEDEYAFLIGFNEGNIPTIFKDEDYFSDKEKELLGIEKSFELNKIYRENTIKNIRNIKNLTISYKLSSTFNDYYVSSLINDLGYKEITIDKNYNYSNKINELILSMDLDKLVKYSISSEELELLYNNYPNIKYKSYDNKFKGIDKNKLYELINNELTLSYSSIDNFYKCKFKYYINNILKIDKYEETFAIFIGNLFHHILSICFNDGFDFEKEYNDYLKEKELSIKENFFINKLKKDLLFIIETIKKQYSYSNFNDALYENKFTINKDSTIKVSFIGFIDKLLLHKYKDKTLLVIVDYKTGIQELNLGNSIYGLNMQLPVYLYLSKNSDIKNAEVVGFYLQKILNTEITRNEKKTYIKQKEDNLKLQGYTINNEEYINEFDRTYISSEVIKSMGKGNDGFKSYSKLLTESEMNELYKLVDKKIDNARDEILNANFEIDPKRIGFNNVSCTYCKYRDLCFMREEDVVNLEENKTLDFLGGDNNAKLD